MATRFAQARFRHFAVGLGLSLWVMLALPVSAQGLIAIRIEPSNAPRASIFPGWVRQAPFSGTTRIDLELGDEPYGAVLKLDSAGGEVSHRVLVQFETSLAIGDEGPHVDLLDWKHCASAWQVLQPSASGGFVLPHPSAAQASCFPPSSMAELKAALRSVLQANGTPEPDRQRWMTLADSIRLPGDAPSYIGVSKVRVRIDEQANGQWKQVTTLEFMLPLGC